MINKIRAYIDHEFEQVPQTKKVLELKEELLGNLIEKYNDYLRSGKSEEEAYTAVISGIGDISELIDNLREPYPLAPYTEKEIRKRAFLVSIAVGLYIISIIMVPIFAKNFNDPLMGIFVMFLLVAVATGILIYNNMTRKNYVKADDSLVEDFKAYRVHNTRSKAVYNSFKSALWTLTVAIYLLVSFTYGIWFYSWIIFIIAGAIEEIVKSIMILRSERNV